LREVNLDGDTATPTLFIFKVRKLDGRHSMLLADPACPVELPKGKRLQAREQNGCLTKEPHHILCQRLDVPASLRVFSQVSSEE
jgi:hypothetical protein